jgi:ubiquinone/menaquinone biosynthesis C-methylase UbiE
MNENTYVVTQYKTPDNLDARITLHERFTTNNYPWSRWVFDQFALPPQAAILEVGCGMGKLWAENGDRLPAGWAITLIDQSAGMLQQATANVAEHAR